MRRRHPRPPQDWLIVDRRSAAGAVDSIARLPRESGVLLIAHHLPAAERRRLRQRIARIAQRRGLVLVDEADGRAARVHNRQEMTRALARGADMLLLSPMFATRSHPDWTPMPPMRAATLVRLSPRPVLALGGMNRARFERVRPLGFAGWAGIDGWTDLSEKPGAVTRMNRATSIHPAFSRWSAGLHKLFARRALARQTLPGARLFRR